MYITLLHEQINTEPGKHNAIYQQNIHGNSGTLNLFFVRNRNVYNIYVLLQIIL